MNKRGIINSLKVTPKQNDKIVTKESLPAIKTRWAEALSIKARHVNNNLNKDNKQKAGEGLKVLAVIIARVEDERQKLQNN